MSPPTTLTLIQQLAMAVAALEYAHGLDPTVREWQLAADGIRKLLEEEKKKDSDQQLRRSRYLRHDVY